MRSATITFLIVMGFTSVVALAMIDKAIRHAGFLSQSECVGAMSK